MKVNFKGLEILRGLAAFYVVINHCRGNLIIGGTELSQLIPVSEWSVFRKLYYGFIQLTSLGPEAVIVFFVLSGFSIAHSLNNNSNTLGFYKRRFIRLYLPFVLALIYAALVFTLISDTVILNEVSVFNDLISTIKNLFYIPNGALIHQFWSLPMEVMFYILAPFVLVSKKILKYYYVISILLFLSSLVFWFLDVTHVNLFARFIFDCNIYFAVGLFLYRNKKFFIKYKVLFEFKFLSLFSIICIPLMIFVNYRIGYFNKVTFSISAVYSLFLLGYFLNNEIKNNLFQYLGKISYTLYITHFASVYLTLYILHIYDLVDANKNILNPFVWFIAVPVSVIVAIPLYYLGEYPSTKILKRLRVKKIK